MPKIKKSEEESPENGERWLLTYSDMITLLLALFIILYSMSTIDAKKFAKIAESMGATLNGTSTSAVGGGAGGGTGTGTGTGKGSGTAGVQMDALDQIYTSLQAYVDKNHLQDQIGLVNTSTYVQIHLKDKLMFIPDSPNMLPQSEPLLKEVEKAIANVYDQVDHVTFSGHTADVGPHTTEGDQVSWRLSTDRAVTVLNKMIGYGLPEDKISIEGYAHFDPVANNNTEEGRAKNRRVEITVYKASSTSSTAGTASSASSSAVSSSVSSRTSSQVIITHETGASSKAASSVPSAQSSSCSK